MNVYLKKKNNSWQKIALGSLGVLLIVGLLFAFQSPIKNVFFLASSPLLKTFSGVGDEATGFFGGFFNRASLTQENNNLKQENQSLLSQVANLQQAVRENQAIQDVVQNTLQDNFKLTLTQVISLDSANDFALINKGSEDKITQNMPVISSTKVLLGKVTKVYGNFSEVMLISNKNSVVDARVLDALATVPVAGVIKGGGGLLAYLDLVSSNATLNDADTLITSGLEGVFPKNLLIGKITSIDKNDAKPFQTAKIQPFFSTQNIDTFFIITNYLPQRQTGKK